jgi:hypothetical protein
MKRIIHRTVVILAGVLMLNGCSDPMEGELRTAPLVLNDNLNVWASTSIARPNDTAIIVMTFTPLYSGDSYVGLSILSGGTPVYIESPIIDTVGVELNGHPQIPIMFQADSEVTITWKIRFPTEIYSEYSVYPFAFMDSMVIDGEKMGYVEARSHAPKGCVFPDMIWGSKILGFRSRNY